MLIIFLQQGIVSLLSLILNCNVVDTENDNLKVFIELEKIVIEIFNYSERTVINILSKAVSVIRTAIQKE